ncbi:unnamed protein product [Rotaria magnacalcarata]|uniref:Immunoglobulin domain-containing protein n=1 Tax=Rotaria magnacalcarata TaxID=392030 RepID=A0A814ZW50_9BILA|nr:unnamed protein product [Rotaria magnacalcarata]CAF3800788.1 unnamed protein product [Rotaria magnacalcarata]CAF3804867.1 unnamed protein product [Rotaria magnacalcarata]CAF3921337.1 unnamed protein product [Rotaria magnacalcarata]
MIGDQTLDTMFFVLFDVDEIVCLGGIEMKGFIIWHFKPKQFVQTGSRFEQTCEINRPLTNSEHISWILYNYNGEIHKFDNASLIIDSFEINNEGIAICQIKDNSEIIVDEKFFFITNDPSELIDSHFEGYEQTLIDTDINYTNRQCGPDVNINYTKEDIADFHIDFVQHYERVRQHSNLIKFQHVKHENEGYYECIVRLHNGLVGVQVFFLSVGGGPRQLSNRETHIYSEINDSITLLCPIFSALPARFTFLIPNKAVPDTSSLTRYDYLRIKHVSNLHSGMYICRVTANGGNEGYSLKSSLYLDVYGPPEYAEPYKNEYVFLLIKKNVDSVVRCSINANPIANYQWLPGDVQVLENEENLSDKSDYIIAANNNDAVGSNKTMTCMAKNNRGVKRQVFTFQFTN